MWKTVRSGTGGSLGTSLVRDRLARPLDSLPLERLSSKVFVGVMRFVSMIILSVSDPCRGIAEELSTFWTRVLRSTGTAKDSLTRGSFDRSTLRTVLHQHGLSSCLSAWPGTDRRGMGRGT